MAAGGWPAKKIGGGRSLVVDLSSETEDGALKGVSVCSPFWIMIE